MLKIIFLVIVPLMGALLLTSPYLPGELTSEGIEARAKAFQLLALVLPILLPAFVFAVWHKKIIKASKIISSKLPAWMTNDL